MNEKGQHSRFLISILPYMYVYMSIDELLINAKSVFYFFVHRFLIYPLHDLKPDNSPNRSMRNAIFELALI